MADSTITKNALAASLKSLMTVKAFNKISISEICELCHMNRKSFYYHFRDKEDLLNWIFDTEFSKICSPDPDDGLWDELVILSSYLHDNRAFYKKAFKIEGQNSPSSHLHSILYPLCKERLHSLLKNEEITDFQVNFFADGILCAIKRWITSNDCISPEKFTEQIRSCMCVAAEEFLRANK